MRDRKEDQRESDAEAADVQTGLVVYRHQWGQALPLWEVTADLEPIPEAELF
jgi:hypothetical protein